MNFVNRHMIVWSVGRGCSLLIEGCAGKKINRFAEAFVLLTEASLCEGVALWIFARYGEAHWWWMDLCWSMLILHKTFEGVKIFNSYLPDVQCAPLTTPLVQSAKFVLSNWAQRKGAFMHNKYRSGLTNTTATQGKSLSHTVHCIDGAPTGHIWEGCAYV